ncbi:MAG: phosphotransferase [Propionibacteriaceae bacterium]|jgi:maltokinase|nr:phosphotransferase [Propionibacteriaceae bacterium]
MAFSITPAPSLWHDVITEARWFSSHGEDARIARIDAGPWYRVTDEVAVRSEFATVVAGAHEEHEAIYHLIVGYRPTGQADPSVVIGCVEETSDGVTQTFDVVDATSDPLARDALVDALVDSTTPGPMTWLSAPPPPGIPATTAAGFSSNTLLLLGEEILLKIIRRLPGGAAIEAEMLGGLNGSALAPRLLGVFALETAEGESEPITLGLAIERLANRGDGWELAVAACQAGRSFAAEAQELGQTLRLLHDRLADVFPTEQRPRHELTAALHAHALDATADIAPLSAHISEIDRVLGPDGDADTSVVTQRVHGDFHLGQVLATDDGWRAIDFEGEPLKTPQERRQADSPLRDVAGLLRSLDYARAHHPEPDSEAARAWGEEARAAALDGYGPIDDPGLLAAYELDKALYEVVYELHHRPDWAPIPLRAVATILAGAAEK